MKTLVILLLALVAATSSSFGQNLIAVQNGGEPTFYQQVDDAIVNAQDGDTIYIPGGSWDITKPINKRLHLIGVGHNPDETSATFATTLQGTITLDAGASNGSITGIYISYIYGSNNPVSSFTVKRCHIINGIITDSNLSNLMFVENIIEGYLSSSGNGIATNCSFYNNIIAAFFAGDPMTIFPFMNTVFMNNIFLRSSYCNYGCNLIFSGQYFNTPLNFRRQFCHNPIVL